MSFLNVDVTVNVEFDRTCTDNSDITSIVTLPRGSNLLNVLEYANEQFDFMEYEVLYLHNLGYQLFSINQLKDTTDCCWGFRTNPDVSSADFNDTGNNNAITKSLDDVLVSNFGFEVTYRYVSNLDCTNKGSVLQNTSGTDVIVCNPIIIYYNCVLCNGYLPVWR